MAGSIVQKRGRHVQATRRSFRWRYLIVVLSIGLMPAFAIASAEYLDPVERGETPLFSRTSPLGEISYTPGRGLQLGETGFTIGGYANLTVTRDEGSRGELEFDDLSLFIIGDPLPRLHFFAELEYEDAVTIDDHGDVTSPDDLFTAERLYVDVAVTDALNIRTGIFLTPVGRWNVIHAAPLVWTTSQPIATEHPFDSNLTGVMVFGRVFPGSDTLSYAVWDQFAPPLEGNPEFDPADHSVGARLELAGSTSWSIGASYLAARRGGEWRHLGGADFLWSRHRLEVMGEFVVADGGGIGSEWGGYVQPVFALTERLALVGRYEHYASPSPAPSVNLVALGLAFRPFPAVVLKTEYLFADRSGAPDAEPGFKASIATLF